jgi:hypothetical protein
MHHHGAQSGSNGLCTANTSCRRGRKHLSIVENGTEDPSQYTKLPVSQIVKIKPYYRRALRIHANDIRGTFLVLQPCDWLSRWRDDIASSISHFALKRRGIKSSASYGHMPQLLPAARAQINSANDDHLLRPQDRQLAS